MPTFDLAAARAAGYDDKTILEGLAAQRSDFDLGAARAAGYDDTAILEGLAGSSAQQSEGRTFGNVAKDVGVTGLKGLMGLQQSIIGLADITTGGNVGKALESVGIDGEKSQKGLSGLYSAPQQEANRKVEEAKGFAGKLTTALENPSTILTTVGESVPQMIGGAGIARGLLTAGGKALAPWAAGAVGEGVMGMGSAAESIREQSASGLLSGSQSMDALGSGAGTALFGALGGKLSSKLGWGDIDTILARGGPEAVAAGAAKQGFIKQVVGSGISEGVFEELPQSMQETMWQNHATGKPIMEGVPESAAMGLLAGGFMGGAGGGYNAMATRNMAPVTPAPSLEPIRRDVDSIASMPSVQDEIAGDINAGRALDADSLLDDIEAAQAQQYGATIETVPPHAPVETIPPRAIVETPIPRGIVETAVQENPNGLLTRNADAGVVDSRSPVQVGDVGAGNGDAQPVADGGRGMGAPAGTPVGRIGEDQLSGIANASTAAVAQEAGKIAGLSQEAATPAVVLQNRDRSQPESIAQMRGIAANPDPSRLSFSRDAANGAPVVFGDMPQSAVLGKQDHIVSASGRKMAVQYAVVDAQDLIASNDVNGMPVADYINGVGGKLRAVGGNGRVAGLQEAHRTNAAGNYTAGIIEDAGLHGVADIAGIQNPVLVRVMRSEDVTPTIGDEFNVRSNMGLSAVEQARTDAARVKLETLDFTDSGEITQDAIKAFVLSMPESERNELMDGGRVGSKAVDRMMAAIFLQAYGDAELVRIFAQAQDIESKAVITALAGAAPAMARLVDAGNLDIRSIVADAAKVAVNASREGVSLSKLAKQGDFELGHEVMAVVQFMADNIRKPRVIAEHLTDAANFAYGMANQSTADMFGGAVVSRDDVIRRVANDFQGRQENLANASGREPDASNAGDQAADEAGRGDNQAAEGFGLETQTEASLSEDDARKARIESERQRLQDQADAKARAEAERETIRRRSEGAADDFQLGQSAEDNLAGQKDIFSTPAKLPGTQDMAQRQVNASEKFIESVVEQFGLTRAEAGRAWDYYVKNKLVKVDAVGGQYSLKDGRMWDGDAMRKAAGLESAKQGKLDTAAASIDTELDAALKELADALKKQSGQLNSGVDPAILALGVKVGSLYVAKGVVKFAQYSKAIIDALRAHGVSPDQIKPYLKQFYAATKQAVDDATFEKMDDDRTVRGFDLDSLTKPAATADMEKYIKVAADSIETLRKVDVYRVLVESNRREIQSGIAEYIKAKRPDLAAEVDSVLAEDALESAAEAATIDETGESNVTDQRSSTDLERDSQDADAQDEVGEDGVRSGRRGDGGTGRQGIQGAEGEGRGGRGTGVPGREAAAVGERGDFALYTGATELSPGSAGSSVDSRGGDVGIEGAPIEPATTNIVDELAESGLSQAVAKNRQKQADAKEHKPGLDNIRETLPILHEGQQEDVHKAETRFAKPDGYGMLFTNGTGTGKTFTGLGVVKRFAAAGKENILIVAPNDKIIEDWQKSGELLGLKLGALDNTNDAGSGIVITTYANMGQNDALASREWDLVVHDEAHYLAMDKDGTSTNALKALRAISLHPDGVLLRAEMQNRALVDDIRRLVLEQKNSNANTDMRDEEYYATRKREAEIEQEIKELRAKFEKARDAVRDDVESRQGEARPRVLFLSATPFAYEKTVDWANGYLFDYNDGRASEEDGFRSYNAGSNRDQFMMQHFGYRMRYGKLTQPDAKVDTGLMQRQFNGTLKKSGALSGRMLDVKADYDRRFILVDSAIGTRIDEALQWFDTKRKARAAATAPVNNPNNLANYKSDPQSEALSALRDIINEKFDYLSRRYLLEAIKAREVIPHVREHLALGRKVVVFHDYKKGGGFNPFNIAPRSEMPDGDTDGTRTAALNAVINEFRREFRDLIESDVWSASSPITAFIKEFPNVLLFNGDVPKGQRRANVAKFQDDASGPQIMLVQSAAGKEGISLHDTTGKHQRVLFNLGQPTQPTTAIQQEGRIYRTGQVTDAIFRYLNTGTIWEKIAFATTIATRASAAENLGMGEQARALKDAFIAGFEESSDYRAGMADEGKGGKERDRAANEAITEYDRARAFYYGTAKKTSKTKAQEGTDYFATPEPVGLKMMQWAGLRPGESVLEPSAGHGAIARWAPDNTERTAIEPSYALRPRLAMVFDGKIIDSTFEELNVVNKYDAVVMNPPFGSGGKTAIDHVAKAATHLRDGGRIVALIPTGPAADKKFEKWFFGEEQRALKPVFEHPTLGPIYRGDTIATRAGWLPSGKLVRRDKEGNFWFKTDTGETSVAPQSWTAVEPTGARSETYRPAANLYLVADIKLPQVTFERAGTAVATRVVVIEKQNDKDLAAGIQQRNLDYSDVSDINDLFERLEDVGMNPRSKSAEDAAEPKPTAAPAKARPAKAIAGETVTLDGAQYEIVVYTTNAGKDITGTWVPTKEIAAKFSDRPFQKRGLGWFVRERDFPAKTAGGDTAFSRTTEQPAFYSQLSRAIESAPDKVFATATQFKLWLNSNAAKLGIKKDEIEWSGINDFLDMQGKGKVSKSDATDYLSSLPDRESMPVGPRNNIGNGYANAFGYLAGSQPFVNKGFEGFDRATRIAVLKHVVKAAHDLKILNPIVEFVPVDVVDNLRRQKLSAEMLFNNPTMLADATIGNAEFSVPAIDAANALVRSIAGHTAEKYGRPDIGLPSVKSGSTLGTLANSHDVTPSSSVGLEAGGADTSSASSIVRQTIPESLKAKVQTEGLPMFQRGLTPAESVKRVVRVQAIVNQIKAKWKNAPKIVVISDMQDKQVPQRVRDLDAEMKSKGATGEPRGFITGGVVYIVAGQNKSVEDVITTLAHEALGHAGLRGLFGDALNKILDEIAVIKRRDVIAKAIEYGLHNAEKGATDAEVFASMTQDQKRRAAEEVLAEMAQTQPEMGFVKRAIAAIRNWLRENGLSLMLTDADIIAKFILPARAFIENGAKPVGLSQSLRAAFSRTSQTETEAFKRWFKGSKVVDADGRPLVVYHGTQNAPSGIESFAAPQGFAGQETADVHWFTSNPSVASGYADWATGGGNPTVYPVYIALKNPATMQDYYAVVRDLNNRWEKETQTGMRPLSDFDAAAFDPEAGLYDKRVIAELKASGFDGVAWTQAEYTEQSGFADDLDTTYIAFSPTQVKSAIGNNGDFSPTNPDIAFSRQSTIPGTTTPQAPQLTRQPPLGIPPGFAGNQASWDAPENTGFDDLVYKLQNKQVDLLRVVEAVKKSGAQLADKWNTYLQEELFHGRAAKRTLDFVDRELNPLLNAAAARGLKLDEIDEYLHARHAEEANDLIASRDPAMQDGGSGMKTADARAYLAGLSPDKARDLADVAAKIDAILAKTRQLYADYGLESQDTVDEWGDMFEHYVPLMREDKDGAMGIGQGFSIKGREVKHRTGSTRAVVDILANIAMQREKVIVRGEKNRVAVSLAGLAKLNPNKDFWTFDKVPTERVLNEKTGLVEQRADPTFKSRDNVIVAKIKGKNGRVEERAIVFNESNERAMRMALSLKNMDVAQLEGLMGVSAKITRYFASINTQYNPVFGFVNLTRDVQGAMLNLGTTPLKDHKAEIFGNTFTALVGIYRDARAERRGGMARSSWAALWEDFNHEGGQTGYRDMFATSEDRANKIRHALDPNAWMDSKLGKVFTANGLLRVPLAEAQKQAGWVFDWLSDFNLAMENGVRLSAYKTGLDQGMSKQQAASLAKNLTVNFNRKGQAGQQAGALYAFFNASMQGTARIAETLTTMEPGNIKTLRLSGAGKKIVTGGILLGAMQAVMMAAAGFDDDEPPEFMRERNIIIPIGGKDYITIPMPLGFHFIPNIGRVLTEIAMDDGKDAGKRLIGLFGVAAEAFNPLGGTLSLQTISPTAIDPFVALGTNKDWTGKPIYRENFSNLAPTPGHTRTKDTASSWAKWMSEAINTITGGTDYTQGAASPTADEIDYLVTQLTGGVGRELGKLEQTVTAAATGEELPTYKIPLLGRYYGSSDGQAPQASKFYSNLKQANEHESEIKGRRKDGLPADDYIAEHPGAIGLVAMGNKAERQVSTLRKLKRELVKRDAPREKIKEIDERITAVMTRFNERSESLNQ